MVYLYLYSKMFSFHYYAKLVNERSSLLFFHSSGPKIHGLAWFLDQCCGFSGPLKRMFKQNECL